MLNKIVQGRLGNQMFQYATMRAIQEQYYRDEKINFDFSNVRKLGRKEDGFDNQLNAFSLNYDKIEFDKKIRISLIQKAIFLGYFISYKIIRIFSNKSNYENNKEKFERKLQKIYNKNGLYLYTYGYYDFMKSNNKNKLFVGYYESPRYFDCIKEKIIKEFTPKNERLKKNEKLYNIIGKTNSVCISIRRGDFLSKEHKEDCFVCDNQYFKNAIKEIEKHIENPKYIVFSDDIEWVKENMKFIKNCEYEDGTDPVWEKLRLMYSCKHFIISNSTFSWWAQYLSRNDNKVVIAPKRWRNNNYKNDIYEKNWILI